MQRTLGDHISSLNSTQSMQELFGVFEKIIRDYGYEKVAYGFATDHETIGIKRMHGHMNSFPSDWMSHYAEKSLIKIDPVPAYMLRSSLPVFWDGLDQGASAKAVNFKENAAEAGLKDGALVPLYGPGGEIAGLSFFTERKHENPSFENLAALQLLGTYFHESYKSFLSKKNDIELTKREQEILLWASEGKSDAEIGLIISISAPTVRYHWKNIFQKLDAYGRVYAITKAIRLQLITPYMIMQNYQV